MIVTAAAELTDCDVCQTTHPKEAFMAHVELCAKESNVCYHLKMAVLHELKAEDVARHIFLHYMASRNDHAIHLPRGVCLYCETPQQHQDGRCQTISRTDFLKKVIEMTEDDYFWNVQQSHQFLVKGLVGMLALRQRQEMEPVYEAMKTNLESVDIADAVPEDWPEWPESTATWLQEKRRAHQSALDARTVEVLEACKTKMEQLVSNRRHFLESIIAALTERDATVPMTGRTFT